MIAEVAYPRRTITGVPKVRFRSSAALPAWEAISRWPVLPNSAVEVGLAAGPLHLVRGQLISVDDTSTTVLQSDGEVVFIPNDQVRSKTLCPEPVRPPDSAVSVRGWQIEESALSWIAPTHRDSEVDPRCLGRPLNPS